MKSTEFIQTDEDINAAFVNQTISATKQWKRKGKGYTASVWQHIDDPHTVVKVIGGGTQPLRPEDRAAAIAFYHFCVDHGNKSPHFPRVLEINTDDPEVVQLRIEALHPIRYETVKERLEWLADDMRERQSIERCSDGIRSLDESLSIANMDGKNDGTSIAFAMEMLLEYAAAYEKAHNVKELFMDLHEDNWMMRPDGTIVAADPWYAE